MRGNDGRLNLSVIDRGIVWMDHMEEMMNEKNEWDHMMEANVVEGPIEKITQEMRKAIRKMKLGKTVGPSQVSVEMITASGEIGIDAMIEFCQRVLDGRGRPEEWKTSGIIQ